MCVREDSDQILRKQLLKVTSKVRSEGEESSKVHSHIKTYNEREKERYTFQDQDYWKWLKYNQMSDLILQMTSSSSVRSNLRVLPVNNHLSKKDRGWFQKDKIGSAESSAD